MNLKAIVSIEDELDLEHGRKRIEDYYSIKLIGEPILIKNKGNNK